MSLREFEESSMVVGAGALWREATDAKFLSAVGEGSLPPETFQRWLTQDHLFAEGSSTFLALTIAKTPRPARSVLVAGLSALDAELDWFEEHARQRGIGLNLAPHPTCRRYVDYLIASAYLQPFEVLLAIVYGAEVSYLCAWSALDASGPYAEFIHRWSSPQFVEYVRKLLRLCEQYPHRDQPEHFREVLRHERDFWRMTWDG